MLCNAMPAMLSIQYAKHLTLNSEALHVLCVSISIKSYLNQQFLNIKLKLIFALKNLLISFVQLEHDLNQKIG